MYCSIEPKMDIIQSPSKHTKSFQLLAPLMASDAFNPSWQEWITRCAQCTLSENQQRALSLAISCRSSSVEDKGASHRLYYRALAIDVMSVWALSRFAGWARILTVSSISTKELMGIPAHSGNRNCAKSPFPIFIARGKGCGFWWLLIRGEDRIGEMVSIIDS